MNCSLLLGALLLISPALGQDDPLDDLPEADMGAAGSEPEEDSDETDETDTSEEEPSDDEGGWDDEEPEDFGEDFTDDVDADPADDLLDGEETRPRAEGEDTVDLYRAQLEALSEQGPEERLQAWEAYLAQYPQSLYLEQIRRDITQAEAELYGEEIVDESGTRRQRRGLKFPEMAMGENLNPATRVKVGFDWGIPAWINLIGDVEYAFAPRFSAHMGMRKRYSGWSLDLGPRFAVVKDADLGLIVSLSGDLHVNVDPAFTGLRPGVQVGKILFDKVFVQIQGAPEWQLVEGYWTTQVIGGGQLAYRASRAVGMFIEANLASQYFGLPSRNPTFHTVVFGMRFYPSAKGVSADDKSDVLIGAGIPLWTHPSWDFFDGAATVQSHLYLE